jgi:hypothetical protein
MPILMTRESLRAARACYDAEDDSAGMPRRIDQLCQPEGLPVTRASVELARAAGVPNRDIHWALTSGLATAATPVLERAWSEHACWFVRRMLEAERAAGREPHADTWAALTTSERFVRGEATREELRAAELAAYRDAYLAAYRAADLAAYRAADRAAVDDLVARLEVL